MTRRTRASAAVVLLLCVVPLAGCAAVETGMNVLAQPLRVPLVAADGIGRAIFYDQVDGPQNLVKSEEGAEATEEDELAAAGG